MKLKRNPRLQKMNALHRVWFVIVMATVFLNTIDGIRVYEGTNFPDPRAKGKPPKASGLTKKSLYISKRSWDGAEENWKSLKAPGKDYAKRKSQQTDMLNLYKIKFSEENLMQYVKYIKEIPRLEEYTFCMWYKPGNLTHDHTLFSYSLNKKERLLKFWLSSYDSTLRTSIRGITVYKVPANIRRDKWHHICQSWHGVLGEWQIFLDGKRIGAGVLQHYKETYIPEGGEVVLGQELIGLEKRLTDGLDGELFGFNLVDEAVPGDQGIFINSQYKPNVRLPTVPPFKKLPPIKKTYQEIKAYISKLPGGPDKGRGVEPKPFRGKEPNVFKGTRESTPYKRFRGNQRTRYPPVKQVIIYSRGDRKLPLEEPHVEINKTLIPSKFKSGQGKEALEENEADDENLPTDDESKNENYSIHSYRLEKEERKPGNYEIYENLEDDTFRTPANENLNERESFERKARGNFDLFLAREANKVYTLSNAVKDARKPRFHFETSPFKANHTNVVKKASEFHSPEDVLEKRVQRKPSDPIPVYETEVVLLRRKRNTGTENPLTDGFRRLPQIPDSFISIFTENATKTEMEKKLDQFFPENTTEDTSPATTSTTEPATAASPFEFKTETTRPQADEIITEAATESTMADPLPFSKLPIAVIPSPIQQILKPSLQSQKMAVASPPTADGMREFDPRTRIAQRSSTIWHQKPEPAPERRKFDISTGTELIMRAYGMCTNDRGSPIQDKRHLVISWADTPIRIFGGAEVENARNECGNF